MSAPPFANLLLQGTTLLSVVAVTFGAPPRSAGGHDARRAAISEIAPPPTPAERLGLDFIEPPSTLLGPIDEIGLMLEDDFEDNSEPLRFGVQRRVITDCP